MIKIVSIKIKQKLLLGLIAILFPVYAFSLPAWYTQTPWHPIFSLGAGASISSNVGESKNFPIQNPMTDEFYNYSANHSSQTSPFIDLYLAAEWNLDPYWMFQGGVAYNQTSPFAAKGTFLQGADIESSDSYTYQYGILSRRLLLDGKLLYLIKEHFHAYVLVGFGAAFNDAYSYSTDVPPFLTFTRTYSNHSTTAFSYEMGGGVDADITDQLRLGIGYRFADLGKAQLGSATIDSTSVSGTLSQSHLYTNELLAQMTWLFC